MKTLATLTITPAGTRLNGTLLSEAGITGLYRQFVGDYPKFFKMDHICKLGFLSAELLLKDFAPEEKEKAAVVLFNRSGSLDADRYYQTTIAMDNYFPSPALFVYTLANIVTGEIAIRHKIYGETSFYIMNAQDETEMDNILAGTLLTSAPSFILTGWIEYEDDADYVADMKIVTK
ncbi:MAG: hypothetical protein NC113_08870 [Bacteroides sp.]|nr:hypothetical protein [Bacteroides sp.]MCM1448307.1 hypothetical protein [Bacteroides sp.]MCM1516108.1 hypothetical protein [Paraprevotella sp.]